MTACGEGAVALPLCLSDGAVYLLTFLIMTLHAQARSREIAALNDLARKTFQGCRVVLTRGIQALSDADRFAVLQRVRQFDDFSPDNDFYGEHDF